MQNLCLTVRTSRKVLSEAINESYFALLRLLSLVNQYLSGWLRRCHYADGAMFKSGFASHLMQHHQVDSPKARRLRSHRPLRLVVHLQQHCRGVVTERIGERLNCRVGACQLEAFINHCWLGVESQFFWQCLFAVSVRMPPSRTSTCWWKIPFAFIDQHYPTPYTATE